MIHSELSSDSEEYRIFSVNFALIQRNLEVTSQLVLKSSRISTKLGSFSEIALNQY